MGYNDEGKRCFEPTFRHWLDFHESEINRYLFECVEEYSRDYTKKLFNSFPLLGKIVVEDFLTNSNDINHNPQQVIKFATTEAHEVGLLSGSRGSGKTSTSVSIIDTARRQEGVLPAFIGPPNAELEKRGWYWCVNASELQRDMYGMYDESALWLNARRSMSNTNMAILSLIPTIRHIGVVGILFLTQSTSKSDVSLMHWSNYHIIKDYSDAYGQGVERKEISEDIILDYMTPVPNYIIPSSIKSWNYVRTGKFRCLMHLNEVSWYGDKVGKAYAHFDNRDVGMKFATEMIECDFDIKQLRDMMIVRGFEEFEPRTRDLKFWKDLQAGILGGFSSDNPEPTLEELNARDEVIFGKSSQKLNKNTMNILDNSEHQEYIEKSAKGVLKNARH